MSASTVSSRVGSDAQAAQQAAAAAQSVRNRDSGGAAFIPATTAGVEDARSRVAALDAAAAGTQDAAPPAAGDSRDPVQLSTANSVAADAVQRAGGAFQLYGVNALPQQDYGSSLPRGNVVDQIA